MLKMAPLPLLCLLLLSACGTTSEIPQVTVKTEKVSPTLTAPVDRPAIPDKPTQRDAGVLIIQYDEALNSCNGRLETIHKLHGAAE